MSELSLSDEWRTPAKLYRTLDATFGPFTLDAAAARWNRQCERYCDETTDGLSREWLGRVWCNPPYSRGNLEKWVAKARHEVKLEHAELVCMLVPAYTAEGWWQRYVETPEGRPLGALWLYGRLDRPLLAWRRQLSVGLTVDVISIAGRLAFTHKSGVAGTARHASAVVVFSKFRTSGNELQPAPTPPERPSRKGSR